MLLENKIKGLGWKMLLTDSYLLVCWTFYLLPCRSNLKINWGSHKKQTPALPFLKIPLCNTPLERIFAPPQLLGFSLRITTSREETDLMLSFISSPLERIHPFSMALVSVNKPVMPRDGEGFRVIQIWLLIASLPASLLAFFKWLYVKCSFFSLYYTVLPQMV